MWLDLFIVCVVGLMFGSFATLLSYRFNAILEYDTKDLVREISNRSSQCNSCGTKIENKSLIPVFSFFAQKGKTSCCKKNIGYRYPLIELTSLFIALIAYYFSFGSSGQNQYNGIYFPSILSNVEFLSFFVFSWFLLVISIIDIENKMIPDRLSLLLLWIGLVLSASVQGWHITAGESIIAASVGYAILWFFYQAYLWIKNVEAMGYGDFKLMAAICAWTGYQNILEMIILSCILGVAYYFLFAKRSELEFPFGPSIALSGLITFYWNLG